MCHYLSCYCDAKNLAGGLMDSEVGCRCPPHSPPVITRSDETSLARAALRVTSVYFLTNWNRRDDSINIQTTALSVKDNYRTYIIIFKLYQTTPVRKQIFKAQPFKELIIVVRARIDIFITRFIYRTWNKTNFEQQTQTISYVAFMPVILNN